MEIRVARHGKEIGTFDEKSLAAAIVKGAVERTDWAWHEGLISWLAVGELLDRGAMPPPPPAKAAIVGRDWTQDIATQHQLRQIREFAVVPAGDLTKAQARDLLDQLTVKYPRIAASQEKRAARQRSNPVRDLKDEIAEASRQLKAAKTPANTEFHRDSLLILKKRLQEEISRSKSGCGCGCLPFVVALILAYGIYMLIWR